MNIRRVAGIIWKGQRAEQTDREFVQFSTMEWGLRAAFCLLRTYRDKYRLNCIADIIRRWAPPSENNTQAYVCNVCRQTGLGGMQPLTESDWPALVQAMARQECGVGLPADQINRAFEIYRSEG